MFYKTKFSLVIAAMLLTLNSFRSMAQNIQIQLQASTYPGGYHVPCNGDQNAGIQAMVSGGQEPYSFSWSNGSTQSGISGLGAGQYSLTVVDANGISASSSIQLFEPNALSSEKVISDYNGYGVRGAGSNDGSIMVIPSGGTAPYNISWSNSETSFSLNGLSAGNYSFTLTDANGCQSNGLGQITEPAALSASINVLQPVSCYGAGDGIAEVQASGGVPPYRIYWSNGSMDALAIRLSGGDNRVQVEDNNGIVFETTLQLSEPLPLSVNLVSPVYPNGFEVSCFNCYNGSIQSTVSGGTAPYSYDWGNAALSSNATQTALDGGLYQVKVTDAHGCFVKENISLKMPERNDWTMSGNQNVDPQNQFIGTTDNSDVVFKTNGTERMRIDGNGNVKFGGNIFSDSLVAHPNAGDFPYELLVVDSTGQFKLFKPGPHTIVNSYSGGLLPGANGADCRKELGWGRPVNSANGVLTVSQNDDLVKCPAEGNVGIGTYSPDSTSKLDVIGDVAFSGSRFHVGYNGHVGVGTDVPIEKFEVNGGARILGKFYTKDEVFHYNTYNWDHLKINFDGANAKINYHSADPAGRLLINVDNPRDIVLGGHTEVRGQLNACKVVVETASWCDYVFEENYALRPLNDLENYLKENKHLPNIPSAAEMEETGIDVAQMTRLHMQKIEELTLYVIELQKQIEQLKSE